MANAERLILCGGTTPTSSSPGGPVHLRLRGPAPNVHCVFEDVGLGLGRVPVPFLDLIDLAAYVYAADQAVPRGGLTDPHFGVGWRRRFRFRVPVRRPDLWRRPDIVAALVAALNFLSEDEYHFEFLPWDEPADALQPPLFSFPHDEVLLFSGGLDSFGGAVREAVVEQRHIALIQHRSSPKSSQWIGSLLAGLRQRAGAVYPFLVPVRINKDEQLTRESTQRTRSFLFTALGASAAVVLGLSRLRVYENGVVAVNLPIAGQVVGARASRTAHPRTLTLLGRLYSLLAERAFHIDNPFADHSKTEVLQAIAAAGCADLIGLTNSCAHPREASNAVPHCGRCSQCIDRRFAVLAAGLEAHDPATRYQRDLLTGERTGEHPRTMVAAYVERAQRLAKLRSAAFFGRYGEAARAIGHLHVSVEEGAEQVFRLHQRHAADVVRVVEQGIAQHARAIVERSLPPSCLLRLVCDAGLPTGGRSVADAPPSVPAPPPAPLAAADHVFRRRGRAWSVRFRGGSEFILLPSKGAAYLHQLLRCPGQSIPAADLAVQAARSPHLRVPGGTGPASEPDTLAAYRVAYDDVRQRLAEARKNQDLAGMEKWQREMAFLADQIQKDSGFQGHLRQLGDDRERVRKALTNALTRVVRDIRKFDPALAEHLGAPTLIKGRNPCYQPSGDLFRWETE